MTLNGAIFLALLAVGLQLLGGFLCLGRHRYLVGGLVWLVGVVWLLHIGGALMHGSVREFWEANW